MEVDVDDQHQSEERNGAEEVHEESEAARNPPFEQGVSQQAVDVPPGWVPDLGQDGRLPVDQQAETSTSPAVATVGELGKLRLRTKDLLLYSSSSCSSGLVDEEPVPASASASADLVAQIGKPRDVQLMRSSPSLELVGARRHDISAEQRGASKEQVGTPKSYGGSGESDLSAKSTYSHSSSSRSELKSINAGDRGTRQSGQSRQSGLRKSVVSWVSNATSNDNGHDTVQHPLIANAPDAAGCIRFVRLDYFEELLLAADATPFPRMQDLPERAFGVVHGSCMLASISHGWFFQCHPDPFCGKRSSLLDIVRRLRAKYPRVEILIFFDFLSVSQRPFQIGQAPRTEEEHATFLKVLSQMHFCYCYSDLLIHVHAEPPKEDTDIHTAIVDMQKVEVAQVGHLTQVIGLHQGKAQDGLTCFDIIQEVDGDLVRYLRRPFGKLNLIPVQERGWVYLERFITMLKAAMVDDQFFDDCIFSNSQETKSFLHEGARRLRDAAEAGLLLATLQEFKDELFTKQFSGASTDKLMLDAQSAADTNFQHTRSINKRSSPVAEDAATVATLMDELIDKFGHNWVVEQEKQRAMRKRFHARVPLMKLCPRSFKDAVLSVEPFVVLTLIVPMVLLMIAVSAGFALAVVSLEEEAVPYFISLVLFLTYRLLMIMQSSQHEVGFSTARVFLHFVPALICDLTLSTVGLSIVLRYVASWQDSSWLIFLTYLILFCSAHLCTSTTEIFALYSSPVITSSLKRNGRQPPRFCKKMRKSLSQGLLFCIAQTASVMFPLGLALRVVVADSTPVVGCLIVISSSIAKQLVMYVVTTHISTLQFTFVLTDSFLFGLNTGLTFSVRLMVSSLSSTTAIFACSLTTSVLEMGSSMLMLYHSHRRVQKMLKQKKLLEGASTHCSFQGSTPTEAIHDISLQLDAVRRQMATEVLFLVNELFTELYCIAAATLCGMILRSSSVVTLLSNEMAWSMFPKFMMVQYGPELLDAWGLIVFLRWLGFDWHAMARHYRSTPRNFIGKSLSVACLTMCFFFLGIGRE